MKIRDLRARLERLSDDNDVVIPVEVMGGAVGGQPFLNVTNLHAGFDWDRGKVFVSPETPLHEGGDRYKAEQKAARDKGEALAFIWMSVTSRSLDDKQKLRSIRSTLRRFGFMGGVDDDGNPAKAAREQAKAKLCD